MDTGATVSYYENSWVVDKKIPVSLQGFFLHEKPAQFNRESIPEHIVHAKGIGAYGKFTVNHDVSRYIKAKLFPKIGKKTKVFVRFSTVRDEHRQRQNGIIASKRDDIITCQVCQWFRVNPKPEVAIAEKLHINIGVRTTSTYS